MKADVIDIVVRGTPRPQGSKRHIGKGVMVESSKYVGDWRADVRANAVVECAARHHQADRAPYAIVTDFRFRRPKGHYRTKNGEPSGELKESAPKHHVTKPDLDKLQRAIKDALSGVVWADDSQVVSMDGSKAYDDGEQGEGVTIRVIKL